MIEELSLKLKKSERLSDAEYLKILEEATQFIENNSQNPTPENEMKEIEFLNMLTNTLRHQNKYHIPHPASLSSLLAPSAIQNRSQRYFSLQKQKAK